MSEQIISEVANADWQFETKRTYVLAAEIFDQKLSDGEYRLLTLLRFRASGGDNNFVSHSTLAQDLNIHEKTVAKRMGKLKKLGYITCRPRGFAKSNIKTITSMVERYDKDILLADKKTLTGMDRTPEFLARLHNLQVPEKPIGSENATNGDPDPENDSHRERKDSLIGNANAPIIGSENATQNRLSEIDEPEVDTDSCGICDVHPSDEHPSETVSYGDSKGSQDRKSKKTKGEIRATPDSRPSVDELQRVAAVAKATATERSQAASDKREAKKARKEASGEAEEERRLRAAEKARQKALRPHMEKHIRTTFCDWFPDVKIARLTKTDWGKIHDLIKVYDDDYEFVKKGWSYICENWDEVKQRLKIDSPVPTIGILAGFRESIFVLIQDVKTKRQEQEKGKERGTFEW